MRIFSLLVFLFLPCLSLADVVKPALIEITVFDNTEVEIEIRASIEAILTGINSQYKNTQDSPQAAAYDKLRILSAPQLKQQFFTYSNAFKQSIWLKADTKMVSLALNSVKVPEPGYTKIPRISTITLSGELPVKAKQIQWYYPSRYSDNAVRVRQTNARNQAWYWGQWQWIRDNSSSKPTLLNILPNQASRFSIAVEYIKIGFSHVIPKGSDHLLFILGLFLFSKKWRPLVWQVTTFTVAHTITLGLAGLGHIDLPPRLVEPLIAISIVVISIENLWQRPLSKVRLMTIFCFGLLHGLGFANALASFDQPTNLYLTALVSFNIGVELAQLTVLVAAWLCLSWWLSDRLYRRYIVVPISVLIGVIGLIWFGQRLAP